MKIIIGIVIALAVLLAASGGIALWLSFGKIGSHVEPTAVRVEPAARGDLVEIVRAPGDVGPKTKVSISARISARIMELPYKAGQTVTKGDPNANPPAPPSLLVRLDDTDLRAMLRSVEARRDAQAAQIKVTGAEIAGQKHRIEGLLATLREAQRDLQRQQKLLATGDVSQSVYDAAKTKADELIAQHAAALNTLKSQELSLSVMEYQLVAADAEIAQARDRLTYTAITSPIDGVVTKVNTEVGELAITGTMNNPGTMILEVADLSKMLATARVDESDVAAVRPGQRATVYIRAYPDESFEGVVDRVALTGTGRGQEAREFPVEILLTTGGRRLYSGLNADVEIETRRHAGVLKVPSQAVLGRRVDELPESVRQGNPCVDSKKTFATVVYRLVDGKAVVTPVEVGPSDPTHTAIRAGLTEGDRVITGPYKILEKLAHDQPVKEEKQEKPPATQPAAGPATAPAETPGTRPASAVVGYRGRGVCDPAVWGRPGTSVAANTAATAPIANTVATVPIAETAATVPIANTAAAAPVCSA